MCRQHAGHRPVLLGTNKALGRHQFNQPLPAKVGVERLGRWNKASKGWWNQAWEAGCAAMQLDGKAALLPLATTSLVQAQST